ncbi:hypothetical protein KY314_03060 [Candidatus Woesearchaeota archaeon]|nr:hypothetical protein [Candidatus Woesearchaeota archaeon]
MRLFKNKKGLDYSAWMIIVVFIVIIYLFVVIYSKLDVFDVSIGDQEACLMNSYYEGDKILLFVDQSAKFSVYRALGEWGKNGASLPDKFPFFKLSNTPYWFKDNIKYYKDANFYESFEFYFKNNLKKYLEKYPDYFLDIDYEIAVTDDKILGVPLKPVLLPVVLSPEKKEKYGELISEFMQKFGVFGTGIYALRPSFSLDINTHISDVELVAKKIDIVIECMKSSDVSECIEPFQSKDGLFWNYFTYNNENTVVFDVILENINNPYDEEMFHLIFALENAG